MFVSLLRCGLLKQFTTYCTTFSFLRHAPKHQYTCCYNVPEPGGVIKNLWYAKTLDIKPSCLVWLDMSHCQFHDWQHVCQWCRPTMCWVAGGLMCLLHQILLKEGVQTCKLDLTQYLQEDLIANCVFGEPKSEAYVVLNRPLGRRKQVSKCSYHRSWLSVTSMF